MVDNEIRKKYLIRLWEKGYPSTPWQRQKFNRQFCAEESIQDPSEMVADFKDIHNSIRNRIPPLWIIFEPQLKKRFKEVVTDYKRKKKQASIAASLRTLVNNESEEMETIIQPWTSQEKPSLLEAGVQTEDPQGRDLEVQLLEAEMDRDNLKELVQLKIKESKELQEELRKKDDKIKALEQELEKIAKEAEQKIRNLELEKEMDNLNRQVPLYEIIAEEKRQLLEVQRELMKERMKTSTQLPNSAT